MEEVTDYCGVVSGRKVDKSQLFDVFYGIEYPGAPYHVTSRWNERRDIFLDDPDRRKFLVILEDYHDRYGILMHCYVLMDNHYHSRFCLWNGDRDAEVQRKQEQ